MQSVIREKKGKRMIHVATHVSNPLSFHKKQKETFSLFDKTWLEGKSTHTYILIFPSQSLSLPSFCDVFSLWDTSCTSWGSVRDRLALLLLSDTQWSKIQNQIRILQSTTRAAARNKIRRWCDSRYSIFRFHKWTSYSSIKKLDESNRMPHLSRLAGFSMAFDASGRKTVWNLNSFSSRYAWMQQLLLISLWTIHKLFSFQTLRSGSEMVAGESGSQLSFRTHFFKTRRFIHKKIVKSLNDFEALIHH